MKKSIRSSWAVTCFFIVSFQLASTAMASQVFIMVSEKKDKACLKALTPEMTQYLLSTSEVISSLDNYFKNNQNPDLRDAAINNAGIRFCSEVERKAVLSQVVQAFDRPKINKKMLAVATNYYRTKMMRELIKGALESESTSPQFRKNLNELKTFASAQWSKH